MSTGHITPIRVDTNRLEHMLQVGRTAEGLASEMYGWDDGKCREMFLLGYLHDIGYEHSIEQFDHSANAGELLRASGYKYWQEIRWHGIASAPYSSKELIVLNVSDFLTDGNGKETTLKERLLDIVMRYGNTSRQYIEAKKLANEISAAIKPMIKTCPTLSSRWIAG